MIDPTFLCQDHFAEFEVRQREQTFDFSVDCILCEIARLEAAPAVLRRMLNEYGMRDEDIDAALERALAPKTGEA